MCVLYHPVDSEGLLHASECSSRQSRHVSYTNTKTHLSVVFVSVRLIQRNFRSPTEYECAVSAFILLPSLYYPLVSCLSQLVYFPLHLFTTTLLPPFLCFTTSSPCSRYSSEGAEMSQCNCAYMMLFTHLTAPLTIRYKELNAPFKNDNGVIPCTVLCMCMLSENPVVLALHNHCARKKSGAARETAKH